MKKHILTIAILLLTKITFGQSDIKAIKVTGTGTDTTKLSARIDYKTDTVQTIASLQAYNGGARSLVVTDTLQGGIFYRSSTGIANGGTCFTANFGGYWKRKTDKSHGINVQWFGAKGYGSINDGAAIESAILYAYQNGFSTVYFPPGVYNSTADSITIRSNIRYLGYGATIKQINPNTAIFYADTCSNVTFEGLTLQGLGTDYTGTDTYSGRRPAGIYVNYALPFKSKNLKILNCNFKNFAHSAIYTHDLDGVWIENNNISGIPQLVAGNNNCFGINLSSRTTRATIIGNIIDSTAQGICALNDVTDLQIIGNRISNITGQHGIYLSSASNSIISNNNINNCANNGILIQLTYGNTFGMENVVVSNNTIDSAFGLGIYVYRVSGNLPLRNFNISNNIIRGDTTNLGVAIQVSNVDGAIINANSTRGYKYGMYLTSDKNITVSNYTSYQSSEAGIVIDQDSTTNITFDNVRLYEPTIKATVSNNYSFWIAGGKNITLNNVYVRDTLLKSAYSLYIQPNVDQSSLRITNSTFLSAPVRFESTKSIAEFGGNLVSSYYNQPLSISQSRITFSPSGTTPNVGGATVSGSSITLQPASDVYPGIVSTGTQYFAGSKYYYNGVTFLSIMQVVGEAYFSQSFNGANKGNSGYLPVVQRNINGVEAVWDLRNVGTLNLSDMNIPPVSATATGARGEIRFTSTGIYICIATNSWIKCVGATF
jgi:parallel beta-helix repeat protein